MAMTLEQIQAERAAFEAWARREGYAVEAMDMRDDGTYHGIGARNAWNAWLARSHLTQPAQAVDVERQWREMFAIYVAGPMLYTDDGELSDATAIPAIDFLRDSADTIACKLADRARNNPRALSAEKAGDLQPEDSRCPPTYRREEAVKALIGMGWTWDGRQWVSSNKAESPLSKLQKTLMLRAKALKESGDEWMEDMGYHYEGIAEELAAAMLPASPTPNKEG